MSHGCESRDVNFFYLLSNKISLINTGVVDWRCLVIAKQAFLLCINLLNFYVHITHVDQIKTLEKEEKESFKFFLTPHPSEEPSCSKIHQVCQLIDGHTEQKANVAAQLEQKNWCVVWLPKSWPSPPKTNENLWKSTVNFTTHAHVFPSNLHTFQG